MQAMKKKIFIPAVIALLSGNPGCDQQEKQVNIMRVQLE
jgi:hypothetical protein